MFDKMTLRSLWSVVKSHSCYLYKPHATLLFFSSSTHRTHIVSTYDHLINKHQFSPESASKVSSFLPHLQHPEKTDSVLSFLNRNGFSNTQLEHVVQSLPKILCFEPKSTIKPIIKIFQDRGFSPTEIAKIISSDPRILKHNRDDTNDHLKRSLLVLHKVLGSSLVSVVNKYFKQFPHHDLDKSLLPNVEFLQSWGISSSQIIFLVSHYPRYLVIKPDTFKETAKKVEEMGISRESKMFIYGLRTLRSMKTENWERKLDLFRSIGLSECDIMSTFKRVPFAFAVSERKIKEMAEILLGSGLYDISFIVDKPQVLIYSIERTIKPRIQVLKVLKRDNLLTLKGSTYVYCMSEKKFIAKFVLPFLDRAPELLEMVNETKHRLVIVERSEPSQV